MSIVLSLCDLTGTFAEPWAEAGHTVYTVDLQHPEGETRDGNIVRVGADLLRWQPPLGEPVAFVAAFPPCTDLAVSGARWFRSKGLRALIDALELVERCRAIAEASGAPWFLENPVSTISTYWRKPDETFHPADYGGYPGGEGDGYTKRTCLWTGGGVHHAGSQADRPRPRHSRSDPQGRTGAGAGEPTVRDSGRVRTGRVRGQSRPDDPRPGSRPRTDRVRTLSVAA